MMYVVHKKNSAQRGGCQMSVLEKHPAIVATRSISASCMLKRKGMALNPLGLVLTMQAMLSWHR